MKSNYFIKISVFCMTLLTALTHAASPHGVSNNLQLWLKADTGISETDGQSVTSWLDQSPNAYSATNGGSDSQTSPTFRNNSSDNINFNPVVEFDGMANGLDLYDKYIYSSNDGMTFFAVLKPDVEPNEGNYIYDFGMTTNRGYGFIYANDSLRIYTATDHGGVISALIAHSYGTDSVLFTGKIDFNTEQRLYLNGTSVYNQAITLSQLTTAEIIENPTHASNQKGPVTIGRQSKPLISNDRLFDGKIAEIIVYDNDLSDADRNKVQSYLAIKYGLTLDSSIDYVNSAGLTIYPSTSTHSTHIHDIAVIGAETVSDLSQPKSRSVNDDAVVTIEGASIGDGNYLAWGNDDGDLSFIERDTPYGKRLQRDWKTSELGGIGSVTVSFDLTKLNGAGLDITDATKYRLLIDDDGDFSDATATSGGTISSDTISFSNVSLGNPIYFSLAFDVPSRTTYDFNNLTVGDVNGQDGWTRANWTATGGPVGNKQIIAEGFDGSNNLSDIVPNGGSQSIASHANTGNLTFFPFIENAIYAFEFDMKGNYWGQHYGLGYDLNENGQIGKDDTGEKALYLHSASSVSEKYKLYLPNGSTVASSTTHTNADWGRFRILVDLAANSGQGAACVVYKNLTTGDTDWQSMADLQAINLGLDASRTANDVTNPYNWDNVFFWSGADKTWLDNLAFDDAFTFSDADVSLSNSNVSESVAAGTLIGNIEVATSATYTYSLVAGTGDTDNALFTFDGNQLKTNAVLDYEEQTTRSIRVQVKRTDSGDCAVVEKVFTITIDNVNEIPVAGSGSALDFDGTDDYVDLGTLNGEILGDNARTIEVWIKTTASGVNTIFRYGPDVSRHRIRLSTESGSVKLDLFSNITQWSVPNINDGNWHHIAWSYAAGQRVSESALYVDGVLITDIVAIATNDTPDTQSGIAYIGKKSDSAYFQGQIDEVRLWNVARTQAEIQANMYTPLTGSETGLVSYWDFEEATGLATTDLNTSNANNGTLTNMDDSDWVTGIIGSPTFSTSLSASVNDTLSGYDSDGGTITYGLVDDDGGAAVLTDANTGAFTYTPTSAGTHTFTYKVNDGFDDSNIATVTIEVEPNVAPIAGFGSALDFDGVDDYIEVPNVPYVQISSGTSATFELWLKTTSTTNTFLLSKSVNWHSSSNTEFALAVMNGKLRFNGKYSTGSVNDGQLHHVAVVINGLSGTYYIDGELDSTFTLSANSEQSIAMLIGARRTTSSTNISDFFSGYMDEIRIWNTARTQSEIQANMYQALQGNETGLIGYWSLDENTGTTIADLTENATDGTFSSAPVWTDSEILVWETNQNTPIGDTLPAYDSDGGTLTYSLVDNDGGAAVLTDANTGTFTYTPISSGTRSFTYKVNDGFDDSNIATVTIEVEPNIAPIAGFGSALDFDGTDDYVDLGTLNGEILGDNARTFEAWIKTSISSTATVMKYGSETLSESRMTWRVDNGQFIIEIRGKQTVWSAPTLTDGNWHHVAWSYSAGSNLNQGLLYVDGVAMSTITNAGTGSNEGTTPPNTQSGNAYIGTTDTSLHYFTGQIDEVRLWNVARTQAEIQANMYTPLTGSETGLVSYWDFEEGTGTTTNDLNTTNANHGTLTNMNETDWVTGIIGNPTFTVNTNAPITGTLSAYDSDGGTLTYSLVDDDNGAAEITNTSTGAFSYTPYALGSYTFSYKVNDGFDDSNIATVNIEVTGGEYTAPAAPTDFTASVPSSGNLEQKVGLSWTDTTTETSYTLSREGSVITTLSADITSYTDDSLSCGATYDYSLYASNDNGDSDSVSVTASMPACPVMAPNEPIDFAAIPSYNQVQLNWTDSSSLESGYKILRDGKLIETTDSDIETYIDKNVNCETTYDYEIYAYNSVGDSITQTLTVTTETCPTLVPGNLSAIVTADSITLTWEDVEGETGYLVTRESLTTRRLRAVTEFDLAADTTTFTDSGFECGQSYDYAVAAVTDSGVSEAASITVDAEACASIPTAPSQLIAEAITYASVSLRWSDDSDNETGFYVLANGNLAREVSRNGESATIRGLECETDYSFRITAYNAQGQASSENIVVITDTCPLVNLVAPSQFDTSLLSNNQIQLTWSDNSSNEAGFPIARNGEFIGIAPINAESFIDTNITCGTEYIYHLYATDNVINVGGLEEIITTPECLADGDFYIHLNTIGSGMINNCNATVCSLVATSGMTVNLVATANQGWQFSHWSGDCTDSQLLVDAEKNCLANFTPIAAEPTPETPIITNPLDPTIPRGAYPIPWFGADICGTSFTNHNSTTGNLNICETASVAGGHFIGDNINAGLVSNFILNQNATITGGRLSGFNTNYGMLQDLTITQYSEITGGFYAGSINNNGTMIDAYITEGSIVYSSMGQGTITGITQNKGTIRGVMNLGGNASLIGGTIDGTISAPYNSPAYIGAAEILPGSTLQNVYLSPTVKLPRDVTLINVKQAANPAEPSLDDFGVNMTQLDGLDARTIVAIEPAAISLFDRYEIASIPTEAFAGMTPEQTAAFTPETTESMTVEQFKQLPPEAMAGFTSDNVTALSPEVMQSLTPEQLEAFNSEALQQAEQIAKLLTNLQADTPQELINKILPQGWEISATGKIIPSVGSKLSFKGVLNRLPSNVLTPYLVDFQSSFTIGGEIVDDENNTGSTIGGGFNIGLQQTPSIDSVDLDQFIFTQNEYGIFNVVGTGDYGGIVFAFMPNANNIEQAPLDTPVGLTTIEGGYFEMTTPDKQTFILVTAPNNPVGLQQALGGESEVKLSPSGDVLMRVDTANTRSRNIRFETDVMMVGVFDAFVEPAPDGFCIGDAPCDFGMEFPADFGHLRARQEARVIYPDGSAQTIYPTVIYPEVLINLLEQYDSVPKVLYKSDGTFDVTVLLNEQEQQYHLMPNINIDVRRLEAGEKRNPKVNLQGNILFYEIQEGDDLLTFSLDIEVI